jgi:hypothetical protein
MRVSISLTRVNAWFQRSSSSAATRRLAGSAASYVGRRDGGVAHRFQVPKQGLADLVATRRLLSIGLNCCGNSVRLNNFRIAASMALSTRKPPKAMQRGSPLSSQPRL